MTRRITAIFLLAFGVGAYAADDAPIHKALAEQIKYLQQLAQNSVVVKAVMAQNSIEIPSDLIETRDTEWKASKELTPFKEQLIESEAGQLFKGEVEDSTSILEIFLTDKRGANVAIYPPTSDYWQGDEEKWTIPFKSGENYFGPTAFDESTAMTTIQVSIPIKEGGNTIGVMVAGVSVRYIASKLLK